MLTELIRNRGYSEGVEVGVFRGRNLGELLRRNSGLRMWAVEIDPLPEACELAKRYSDRITLLQGPSVEMAGHVGRVDFVFIDGDHSAEAVSADIRAWRPKVRPGGMLCGHDYGDPKHPGVRAAVDAALPAVSVHDDCVWSIDI